jgi:hypothetical protein
MLKVLHPSPTLPLQRGGSQILASPLVKGGVRGGKKCAMNDFSKSSKR